MDAADASKVLEGAIFELYDSKNSLVDTKTTNAKGKIVFENLPYDNYTLKEITAPNGYAIDSKDSNVVVTLDKSDKEITIKNNKIIRAFKLKK